MRNAILATVALLVVAGCTGKGPTTTSQAPPSSHLQVLKADGTPASLAQVSALAGNQTLWVGNADASGRVDLDLVPAAATTLVAGLDGTYGSLQAPFGAARLTLSGSVALPGLLGFRAPVDLLCTTPDQVPAGADCGQFGEPVVEVAGDGAIWASATCCIGKAPPIWVSRDGGKTFPQMRNTDTGLVRDAFGIEGDFAIDAAGNVYFFDIGVATTWFTSYKADGTHRFTGTWPSEPLVDRPWVRAGAEDQVWVFYNTGSATNLYSSTNGGLTWTPTPYVFPCGLGNPGQGPKVTDLYVAAVCGSDLTIWTSHDGGTTWDQGQKVPMPDVGAKSTAQRGLEVMNPPTADEAGNLYVPFTHIADAKGTQTAIFVAVRNAAGTWLTPHQASPAGLVHLPWGAAARNGTFGLFWYQANATTSSEDQATWYLYAGASVDAASDSPNYQVVRADGTQLLKGPFGRELGDFIETDLTPDGRMVTVYAVRGEGNVLTNRFLSSDGLLDLGMDQFRNGPHA